MPTGGSLHNSARLSIGDINHQVGYADLLLARLGIKYLIVEAKAPGALAWHSRARDRALEQARRYAHKQKVESVAVSDGVVLYAADISSGGLQQRVACRLEHGDPQQALWWLSVHDIYRQPPQLDVQLPERPAGSRADAREQQQATREVLLHRMYKLPAWCFAYVGDPSDPRS